MATAARDKSPREADMKNFLGVLAIKLVVLTAAFSLYLTGPAQGEAMVCGPHEHIAAQLYQRYAEAPIGMGLSRDGLGVTFYASATGTWTIVTTTRAGLSCVRAGGTLWRIIEPQVEGEDT